MSQGWMRVREAAALLSVSESTIRRRVAEGDLRGRSGKSGRQEVFVPAKQRRQAEAQRAIYETSELLEAEASDATDASSTTEDTPAVEANPDPVSESQDDADASSSSGDIVKRYERLAGGSLMLAQKRADELHQAASAAYENLAHTRDQLRLVRKVALAGWGAGAVAILLAVTVSLAFGISSARAQARAQASEDAAQQAVAEAESLRDRLVRSQSGAAIDRVMKAHASAPTD